MQPACQQHSKPQLAQECSHKTPLLRRSVECAMTASENARSFFTLPMLAENEDAPSTSKYQVSTPRACDEKNFVLGNVLRMARTPPRVKGKAMFARSCREQPMLRSRRLRPTPGADLPGVALCRPCACLGRRSLHAAPANACQGGSASREILP